MPCTLSLVASRVVEAPDGLSAAEQVQFCTQDRDFIMTHMLECLTELAFIAARRGLTLHGEMSIGGRSWSVP